MAYLNWKDRFIAPRKRQLRRHNLFWNEKAKENEQAIVQIANKLSQGIDVNRRISRSARIFGYLSSDYKKSNKKARWLERDLYLNAHDTHHLHLGVSDRERSNDLLFVGIGREVATLLMVGDHESFDAGLLGQRVAEIRSDRLELVGLTPPRKESTEDRAVFERLGFMSTYEVNGKVIAGAMQSTSGASVGHVRFADKLVDLIEHFENRISEDDLIANWFKQANVPLPKEPSLVWRMQGCDLILVEESVSIGFTTAEGNWCR